MLITLNKTKTHTRRFILIYLMPDGASVLLFPLLTFEDVSYDLSIERKLPLYRNHSIVIDSR